MEETLREMTFGEKAVGLNFNPSNDPTVQKLKELYAQIIDVLVSLPVSGSTERPVSEKSDLINLAVREAQGAQMWAVKAATWKE